jgi:hypothetical protein
MHIKSIQSQRSLNTTTIYEASTHESKRDAFPNHLHVRTQCKKKRNKRPSPHCPGKQNSEYTQVL